MPQDVIDRVNEMGAAAQATPGIRFDDETTDEHDDFHPNEPSADDADDHVLSNDVDSVSGSEIE